MKNWKFWKIFKEMDKNDPVKHCCVFKEFGCSHVDVYLCDFKTCDMRIKQELWNDEQKLNIPIKDRYGYMH